MVWALKWINKVNCRAKRRDCQRPANRCRPARSRRTELISRLERGDTLGDVTTEADSLQPGCGLLPNPEFIAVGQHRRNSPALSHTREGSSPGGVPSEPPSLGASPVPADQGPSHRSQ